MGTTVTLAGIDYEIPSIGEEDWGGSSKVDGYLIALAAQIFPREGLWTLTGELDYGPTAGILVDYFKSRSANPATTGVLRLANGDQFAFRNNANNADLAFGIDASDLITFNGNNLLTAVALSASKALVTTAGGIVTSSATSAAEVGYLAGVSSAIQTQLNTLTTNVGNNTNNIATNATNLTNHAAATATHGVSGAIVGTTDSQTLTNKVLTSPTINGQKKALSSKVANYPVATTDDTLLGDSSGGTFTFTLPTAIGATGKEYVFKKTDSSFTAITIATTSSQTIDGVTSTTINTQNERLKVVSDGSNWQILSREHTRSWTSFSMGITGSVSDPVRGSSRTENAQWRRMGDSIEILFQYQQTNTGSAGSGTYLFAIPNSLVIDSTKVTISTTVSAGNGLGVGTINSSTPTPDTVAVWAYNTTHLALFGINVKSDIGSASYPLSNATLRMSFMVTVPISGWN